MPIYLAGRLSIESLKGQEDGMMLASLCSILVCASVYVCLFLCAHGRGWPTVDRKASHKPQEAKALVNKSGAYLLPPLSLGVRHLTWLPALASRPALRVCYRNLCNLHSVKRSQRDDMMV